MQDKNTRYNYLDAVREDFEKMTRSIQAELHSDVGLIDKISQYIICAGGKRLRPLLVLLAAKACGYKGEQHITLAMIIEFLHTATLLHDDVVDKSTLRRGKDTANALWGNSSSVLVGDYLYSKAFLSMVALNNIRLLDVLSSATCIIAKGEVLQLTHIYNTQLNEASYFKVIRYKTAALFAASAQTASILSQANTETEKALTEYGTCLGLAFQLTDDLLDYTGQANQLGKNIGDDLAEGKLTLPIIYLLHNGTKAQIETVRNAVKNKALDQIQSIIEMARKVGALEYTLKKAQFFSNKAIMQLSQLPKSQYRDSLESLAYFSVHRAC